GWLAERAQPVHGFGMVGYHVPGALGHESRIRSARRPSHSEQRAARRERAFECEVPGARATAADRRPTLACAKISLAPLLVLTSFTISSRVGRDFPFAWERE